MDGFLDKAEIDIPCEHCGTKTKKSIGWINTHSEFSCACGTIIHLKTDQFKREIAKANKAIADFEHTVKNLFKK